MIRLRQLGALALALGACSDRTRSERDPAPPEATGEAREPEEDAVPSDGEGSKGGDGGSEPSAEAEIVWPDPPPARQPGDRIYSKVRFLWIRPRPNSGAWLGYLSLGDSVRVRGGDADEARAGPGNGERCRRWYAVEPTGYACVGENATLDPDDPTIVALREDVADRRSPWPYRYGESLEVPVYKRPPSKERQRHQEAGLDAHLEAVERARTLSTEARKEETPELVGVDLGPPSDPTPPILSLPPAGRAVQERVARGSTLAYVDRFDHEGRTFLMAWDRGFVPADKVRPFPEVAFEGFPLGDDAHQLPIAWVRGGDAPRYRREDGAFAPHGDPLPRLSAAPLTGERLEQDGHTYVETRDGAWLRTGDVAVAARSDDLPKRVEGDRTWLDVSILGGTLVAYEGREPVYATLVSPGRGGMPRRGIPTLDTASTPTGVFSVLGKFVTATMVSSSVSTLVHAEVQYTQNFSGPYALHGAYWHDRFGEPKSGGCVNLAPIDAKRIFAWTRPRLPPGWHGMRTIGDDWEAPTLVYLHR